MGVNSSRCWLKSERLLNHDHDHDRDRDRDPLHQSHKFRVVGYLELSTLNHCCKWPSTVAFFLKNTRRKKRIWMKWAEFEPQMGLFFFLYFIFFWLFIIRLGLTFESNGDLQIKKKKNTHGPRGVSKIL